jgi:hypothetical protein
MIKILIACIHYPVASGRYAMDAFKRIGCDVRTIGNSTGNVIWGMTVNPKYIWESDGALTASWPDWTPDLVVIMDSAFAYHHPVYADVPHVVYGVDNHVRDYRQAGVERYFLGHNAVSIMDMSAEDVEWLPCAYDPHWFTPSPNPFTDREYDVAMVGVPYPNRVAIVEAMQGAGLNVFAGVGLLYDQYRDAYWNSKISLCVSVNSDLAQRVFETAALGCWVLTDAVEDLLSLDCYDQYETAIYGYESVEHAVERAKEILSIEDAQHVMDKQKWYKDHTWDARAQRIVEWWTATHKPKPKPARKKKTRK